AWYVFTALGFYPVDPASGIYVIGSPLVDKATIQLGQEHHPGRSFTVVAKNNSPNNVYVQSVTLNDEPFNRSWIKHDEITRGGQLVFYMGPSPNSSWAVTQSDRPVETRVR